QRTAVEAVVERDDLVGAVAVELAPFACQRDRPFVGLGAAVGKEHAIKARRARDALGQFKRGSVKEGRRRVDELTGLLFEGSSDLRRAVAQAVHGPTLNEIQ